MNPRLLRCLLGSVVLMFAGCAAFREPGASRAKRNEDQARSAESRNAEYEREKAINTQAGTYERQGMSAAEAQARARRESPGMLPKP